MTIHHQIPESETEDLGANDRQLHYLASEFLKLDRKVVEIDEACANTNCDDAYKALNKKMEANLARMHEIQQEALEITPDSDAGVISFLSLILRNDEAYDDKLSDQLEDKLHAKSVLHAKRLMQGLSPAPVAKVACLQTSQPPKKGFYIFIDNQFCSNVFDFFEGETSKVTLGRALGKAEVAFYEKYNPNFKGGDVWHASTNGPITTS